jgi:hypothetical protein
LWLAGWLAALSSSVLHTKCSVPVLFLFLFCPPWTPDIFYQVMGYACTRVLAMYSTFNMKGFRHHRPVRIIPSSPKQKMTDPAEKTKVSHLTKSKIAQGLRTYQWKYIPPSYVCITSPCSYGKAVGRSSQVQPYPILTVQDTEKT